MTRHTSKANSPSLSRRVALAGLSVAAAAGVIALPAGAAAARMTGDDTELLGLKAKFDPLFAAWVALKIAGRKEHEQFVLIYERESGLSYDDRPAIDWDDPTWIAHKEALAKCREMLGEDEDEDPDAWDKLNAEINPLAADILSYNASTFDGLRLQLRALISAYNETWEPASLDKDEDPEHPCMRNFIESTAGVLGVPFPPV